MPYTCCIHVTAFQVVTQVDRPRPGPAIYNKRLYLTVLFHLCQVKLHIDP